MPYGLKDETIAQICGVLAASKEVEAASLYGSRAKGNYRPGSDIDLVLDGEQITLDVLNTISAGIENLSLPYLVDLSARKFITSADILDHIARIGVVIYNRELGVKGLPALDK